MAKPLMLSIGGPAPEEVHPAMESHMTESQTTGSPAQNSGAPATAAAPSAESLVELYQTVKRHEETLRDLIVEVRLLYHNLSEKEKQRLEARREPTARQVRDAFGPQVRALEEKIARAAGGR